MSIDACMDAGGLWSNFGFNCQGAREGFVPQYKRIAPVFWVLTILVAIILTFIIYKVIK